MCVNRLEERLDSVDGICKNTHESRGLEARRVKQQVSAINLRH